MRFIPVSQGRAAWLAGLLPCHVLQGLAQGGVFLQQVLLAVHKRVF